MELYEFRCEDCGVLFEEVIDQPDRLVSCEYCQSNRVKKLFPVTAIIEGDEDEAEGEC